MNGTISDADIEKYQLLKHASFSVAKGQGVLEKNPVPGSTVEARALEILERMKRKKADLVTLFTYNSWLDWPWFKLHEDHVNLIESEDYNGKILYKSGDPVFPDSAQVLTYDFGQESVRSLWTSVCETMTSHSHTQLSADGKKTVKIQTVDGCFSDRAYVGDLEMKKALVPESFSRINWNNAMKQWFTEKYVPGHDAVHATLANSLSQPSVHKGNGLMVVNPGRLFKLEMYSFDTYLKEPNAILLEHYCPTLQYLRKHQNAVKAGKIVQIHGGYENDCKFTCQGDGFRRILAVFLIGMGKYSYFACHRYWSLDQDADSGKNDYLRRSELDYALGTPGEVTEASGESRFERWFYDAEGKKQAVSVFYPKKSDGETEICFREEYGKRPCAIEGVDDIWKGILEN